MKTAVACVLIGVICGVVGFLIAACLSAEHRFDVHKIYEAGYMEGYDDGTHLRDNRYGTV